MSRHMSPANKPTSPLRNERGSTTRVLLLLLLLVVAAAGYLFYFTDYINPRKEAAKPSVAQTAPVKQPLPPRPGQPGEVKPPAPAPAPSSAPASSAAPAPAQPGQPAAPAPAPPKPEQVKTAAAEAPAPAAPAAKPAPAPAPAKPAPATAKPAPAPAAAKPAPAPAPAKHAAAAAAAKPGQKAAKPAAKKKGGPYRLLVGDFAPGKSFDAVQAKLKKSGITPVRKSAVQAAEPMHRLYVAEYVDQDEAEAALAKTKRLTADAFLIYDDGKYLLFGGSYLSPEKAASERKKLADKGVTTAVRKAQVTVKVTRVTAGSYACSDDARKDAARLKKQGIQATVVKGK